ncbi:MAG TPA: hypothetical protein VJ999_04470 [Candidatus Sulfotelmatobacter sp.]|nr:hypothetical protein [Candidatus Sulfotelmatobacter sp.]
MSNSLTDWIQLAVGMAGLVSLIIYVIYTKRIAEATFKPAIIAVNGNGAEAFPHLRNVGKGPAFDIEWVVTGVNETGKITCIEVDKDSEELIGVFGHRTLTDGAAQSATGKVADRCGYRDISGKTYTSVNDYDFKRQRFSTTFKDGFQKDRPLGSSESS